MDDDDARLSHKESKVGQIRQEKVIQKNVVPTLITHSMNSALRFDVKMNAGRNR